MPGGRDQSCFDRQVLVIAAELQRQYWVDPGLGYARIVISFQIAYAVMMMVRVDSDRIGTGLAATPSPWFCGPSRKSVTPLCTRRWGLAWRDYSWASGNRVFPASMKTIAEWFPRRESALATEI